MKTLILITLMAAAFAWIGIGCAGNDTSSGDHAGSSAANNTGQSSDHAHHDPASHFTCPMHPSVRQADAGSCPACGMDLVEVTDKDESASHYTCPMHPSVREAEQGRCPMCGMDLVEVTDKDESASHYTCPMHPSVREAEFGRCPMCGMDLVEVGEEGQSSASIHVSGARRAQIGLRSELAELRPMSVEVRALGEVVYDETRVHDVVLKVEGWIETLDVDRTGQQVTKGQKLLTLYSPELYSAQRELLQVRASGNKTLVETAKNRLRLWGVSDAQIEKIIQRGEPFLHVPITSPASGVVVDKPVVEGSHVRAGDRLFRIASLDRVWIEASVFETDLGLLTEGTAATVALTGLTGVELPGTVDYVYPYLESDTRTGRIRIEMDNTDGTLKPGMYADVTLQTDLGDVLQIPESAVIFTGPHRLVFVEQAAEHLAPREVRIGRRSGGRYEVLDGVEAGERVVTSGNFLIASESRIRAALDAWEAKSDGQHDH
ncbi:MAG: efflux RND transporter periplasmic adaptor subunit [Candidatus Latescibacterota bacterium]|nr:MAG: efflux RND transporter periplasmic adaptor subunit [Candidatus Latescibacterota bacterium]